jgi:predicted O-linked N-acetylglucosamine transferase (SPINDLY family)
MCSQAYYFLIQGQYEQAVIQYEQEIDLQPDTKRNYWYLGLALLLLGREDEAQMAWFAGFSEGEPEQIEQWTNELSAILDHEATNKETLGELSTAWAIRHHIHEICDRDINNLLNLISTSLEMECLPSEELENLNIIPLLISQEQKFGDVDLLLKTLKKILEKLSPHPIVIEFTEASLSHIDYLQPFLATVLPAAIKIAYTQGHPGFSAQLLELYRRLDANNVEVLAHLSLFYQNARDYERGIDIARLRLQIVEDWSEKVFSSHLLLRGLLTTGGRWNESLATLQSHERLLEELIAENSSSLSIVHADRLFNSCYYLPYFSDDLKKHRLFQNQIGKLCQDNIQQHRLEQVQRYKHPRKTEDSAVKRLKIGYVSHCMGSHSVGWLARWLIKHHNRDRFEVNGYFYNERRGDDLQQWYVHQMDKSCIMGIDCGNNCTDLAERIYQDEIDILIDLDSITLDISGELLSLKPAPIQVTWLGWDASGLPAVDYFIADPYVLPDWAQDFYSEKIWRLPETYIAVDGFEVGIPTVRRQDLSIPDDAVVYFSGQRGYKRHRDTAVLQMKILKETPNSYFLIKGFSEQESVQQFFATIAEEVGVEIARLRFLPDAPSEAIHRANLTIADIVLDTFPYNGATTTLETLWMGIPLVTRVGEQFAARNSYSMMINAGITEGIAWNDDEYIEWGVRLGTDQNLRKEVAWKLRESRQKAPLWNGTKFAKEMENAYEQMWLKHVSQTSTQL